MASVTKRSVVDERLEELAHLLDRRATSLVVALDQADPLGRRRAHRAAPERRAADHDQPTDELGPVERELHRDLAAHRVADDVRATAVPGDPDRLEEVGDDPGQDGQPRPGDRDLRRAAVARQIRDDHAVAIGERGGRQAEVRPAGRARARPVEHHEWMAVPELAIGDLEVADADGRRCGFEDGLGHREGTSSRSGWRLILVVRDASTMWRVGPGATPPRRAAGGGVAGGLPTRRP